MSDSEWQGPLKSLSTEGQALSWGRSTAQLLANTAGSSVRMPKKHIHHIFSMYVHRAHERQKHKQKMNSKAHSQDTVQLMYYLTMYTNNNMKDMVNLHTSLLSSNKRKSDQNSLYIDAPWQYYVYGRIPSTCYSLPGSSSSLYGTAFCSNKWGTAVHISSHLRKSYCSFQPLKPELSVLPYPFTLVSPGPSATIIGKNQCWVYNHSNWGYCWCWVKE